MLTPYVILFSLGSIIGSFLNVVIYRIPNGLSLWSPPSHCPHCSHRIPWYYNVPVWGFLIQLGRCAFCKTSISFRYPAVEILSGIFTCFFFSQFGLSVVFFKLTYLALLMLVLSFIDFQKHLIPNRIVFFSFPFAVLFSVLEGKPSIIDSILGFLIGGLGLWAVWYIGHLIYKRDGIGGGDIKLAALLGVFIGWKLLLLTVFTSFILISAIGWLGIITRRLSRNSEIPLAPFLTVAIWINVFYGLDIIRWYIAFIT